MHRVTAKFVPRILTADQKHLQFLVKLKMAVIPHPPYSSHLTPCDFFLFPKMKLKLKGCRFDTTEEIKAKSQKLLDTLREKGLPGSVPKILGKVLRRPSQRFNKPSGTKS
jgi:hypothetical protein